MLYVTLYNYAYMCAMQLAIFSRKLPYSVVFACISVFIGMGRDID